MIANTFSISNANTYTGGTTVTGTGNLSIGVNNTGSIVGNITNNGIVTLNRDDATTFSGSITGTGSVVQADTGTTTLTAANTYSGGTTINFGALQLGNGGTNGSIVGNVTDNRALIFNRSDAVIFAGVISGTGSVTQTGVGTTALTGTNTYTGVTTISHGTLLVDGAIASSAVTVASGATLGGYGTLGATIIQTGGTLAAGDAPGTKSNLHVNGNLTFQGGALSEDISAATADQIIVSGNASLGGQLVTNFAGSGYGHQTFTLLHANGGLSGAFANVVVTGLPAGLDAYVSYDANNVYLTAGTPRVADFDGLGTSDLVWQNDSGQAAIWLMNGTTVSSGPLVGGNPGTDLAHQGHRRLQWRPEVGLLWQNDSGQADIWLMDGTTMLSSSLVGSNPGPTWHIKGTGDFNGDGKSDILWQNNSGQAADLADERHHRRQQRLGRQQSGHHLACDWHRRLRRRRQGRHSVAER